MGNIPLHFNCLFPKKDEDDGKLERRIDTMDNSLRQFQVDISRMDIKIDRIEDKIDMKFDMLFLNMKIKT